MASTWATMTASGPGSRNVTGLTRVPSRTRVVSHEAQQVAHMGSWEWRIGGERVEWTPELFRIYGLAPAEEGPTFEQFMAHVHPDDRMHLVHEMSRIGSDPVDDTLLVHECRMRCRSTWRRAKQWRR